MKIADFGLAGNISTSFGYYDDYTSASETDTYKAPEQINGKMYDFKVDIYSLGIILFELVVSFGSAIEKTKALENIRNNKFPINFPRLHKEEVNLEFFSFDSNTHFFIIFLQYKLLRCMLSNNPADRPTTQEILFLSPLFK